MTETRISRRAMLAGAAALATTVAYGPARAAKPYNPPASLIDAALLAALHALDADVRGNPLRCSARVSREQDGRQPEPLQR